MYKDDRVEAVKHALRQARNSGLLSEELKLTVSRGYPYVEGQSPIDVVISALPTNSNIYGHRSPEYQELADIIKEISKCAQERLYENNPTLKGDPVHVKLGGILGSLLSGVTSPNI